jgi:hypothetical protein
MPKKLNIVNDPILNDFVYSLLFEASYEEKRGLKGKYMRASMSGEAAKRFATNSTREEKEYIMAHFGVEFFYVVAKRGVQLTQLKRILTKFESDKKVASLKDIAETGLFVTSDKEFLRLLGLTAQSIHHPSFFLNMEMLRQGYNIQKWKKLNLNKTDLQTREADEMGKLLARTFLNGSIALEYAPGSTRVTPNEMRILLYLYTLAHTYVNDSDLSHYFVGYMTKNVYRYAMKALWKDGLIQQHGMASKREFTITGAGVKHVNNFFESAIKQSL